MRMAVIPGLTLYSSRLLFSIFVHLHLRISLLQRAIFFYFFCSFEKEGSLGVLPSPRIPRKKNRACELVGGRRN